jgi:hypothetical protein
MGIDWFAVVVFALAWAFSRIPSVHVSVKNWVFAFACFFIVGWRLYTGAAGANLLFVLIAAAIGVSYVVQAIRTRQR